MLRGKLLVLLGALIVVGAVDARADVIDGHWCFPDGRRISIQGPSVITPAGNHIQGDYSRHFFSYLAPPDNPGAGQIVSMTLLNEDTVRLRVGNTSGPSYDGAGEIWHRCGPPTS